MEQNNKGKQDLELCYIFRICEPKCGIACNKQIYYNIKPNTNLLVNVCCICSLVKKEDILLLNFDSSFSTDFFDCQMRDDFLLTLVLLKRCSVKLF
jgi:hypothetical protein